MATKLFVGSLPYSVNDDELSELFKQAGNVVSAKVIMDRDTQRSKGFGFVEMSTDDEAKAAIQQLNGKEVSGRTIVVNEARSPEERGNRDRSSGYGNNRFGNNRNSEGSY